MAIIRKLLARVGGINGYLALSDSDQVAADAITDQDFTETLGRKADAAKFDVSDVASIIAYLKGLMLGGNYIPATVVATPLASGDLWINSGAIIIRDIIGIVTTTAIANDVTNVKISFDPGDAGADVDLCINVDAANSAIGSIIRLTGDVSDAGIISLDVAESEGYDINKGIVLSQSGKIKVTYGAATIGQIDWFIKYDSLGGVITAFV